MLHFTGRNETAAHHLLHETGLDVHPHLTRFIGQVDDHLTIDINNSEFLDFNWSSGELVLLDVLDALSSRRSCLYIEDLAKLDQYCRNAAVIAIGLAVGVFNEVAVVRDADESPSCDCCSPPEPRLP